MIKFKGIDTVEAAQKLREKVGISKDVTIVALSHRLELWDTDKWNERNTFDADTIIGAMKAGKIKFYGQQS